MIGSILTTILTILTAIICFDIVEKIEPVPVEFLMIMILLDIGSFVPYLIACHIVEEYNDKPDQIDNLVRSALHSLAGILSKIM